MDNEPPPSQSGLSGGGGPPATDRSQVDDLVEVLDNQYQILLGNQNDIGKWLLATLILVNGGAIIGLINAKDISAATIRYSTPAYGFGLAFALGTGVATWANVMKLAKQRRQELNAALWSKTMPPPLRDPADLNGWSATSIACGFLSLIAFVVGSVIAWSFLSSPATGPIQAPPSNLAVSVEKDSPFPRASTRSDPEDRSLFSVQITVRDR